MVSEPYKTCDSGSVCGQFSSLDLVCFGFSVSKPLNHCFMFIAYFSEVVFCRSVEDHVLLQTLGLQSCEMFEGEEQWLTLVESEVFEGILRFDGRKLEEVSRHHQLQPTKVAWRVWWFTEKFLGLKTLGDLNKAFVSYTVEDVRKPWTLEIDDCHGNRTAAYIATVEEPAEGRPIVVVGGCKCQRKTVDEEQWRVVHCRG
eukprot:Gb_26698 [translate_table: standard]